MKKIDKKICNTESQIEILERIVFTFDSSEKDKKFFLNDFRDWLNSDGVIDGKRRSFSQLLWHLTYFVNTNKTIKYQYFNERTQKLYLDKYFYKWAQLLLNKIESKIEKTSA